MVLTPVILPPGGLRLVTRPDLTGSEPTPKTIGIVVVADLAATAAVGLPGAANANVLDNSHTRGNLHRTRNQRLPAGRILIHDGILLK
jgi:hypothetical protein